MFRNYVTVLQMSVLTSMLSNLCNSSNAVTCNLTFLNTPHQQPLSSCNFLPLKVNTYTGKYVISYLTSAIDGQDIYSKYIIKYLTSATEGQHIYRKSNKLSDLYQ